MAIEEEYVKRIFGLKLKQIRLDKKLSLFGLSKLTGLSKSYLNEIEKGKKYPKRDKIILLSEKLDTPYDHMVSLKLDKNLAPLGDILQSKILKEVPLEIFGVKEADLIDIISEAPEKVNAFISTIIEISRDYSVGKENFLLRALRSYQESHNNYFNEIEVEVNRFIKAYHIDRTKELKADYLEKILIEEYDYTIDYEKINSYKELKGIRSIFKPKKKILWVSNTIDNSQKAFLFAKEIAFNFWEIEERLYSFPWVEITGFDALLNNFKASYFAGALLISKEDLVADLKLFFDRKEWNEEAFETLIFKYSSSPETFYQRLTNLLPKFFNIKDLFFLRITNETNSESYFINKQLHLSQQFIPVVNVVNEHYCRRWVSLKNIEKLKLIENKTSISDLQISSYEDIKQSYLVFSTAIKDTVKKDFWRSINLGILLNTHSRKKIAFADNESVVENKVGVTCENCMILDCEVRMAAPKRVEDKKKKKELKRLIKTIVEK